MWSPQTAVAQEENAQPLKQILQKVFGLRGKAPQQEPEDGEAETRRKDLIDQRAPLVREQETLLRSAQTRIDRGQVSEAMEILQSILDADLESVVIDGEGNFQSLRWAAHEKINGFSPAAREMYEKTYGPLARRQLEQSRERSDYETIREVAERYFHTQAGYRAANLIAAHHLDQGEFALAARWYRRLETSRADFRDDPLWRFKVGETYRQAAFALTDVEPWLTLTGEQELELAQRLPAKDSAQARDQWRELMDPYQRPLKNWLFPGGAAHRAGHAQGTPPLLISQWEQSLTDHPEIQLQVEQLVDDLRIAKAPTIPAMQPIVVDNVVVFRTFEGLRAIAADSGEILWESREDVSPAMLLAGSVVQAAPPHQMRMFVNGNAVTPYYGNQAEQHPLASLLFRDGVHGSLSSDGQRVYVIEQNAVLSNNVPSNYYANFNPSQNDPYRRDWLSNRLTAYDLRTGQLLWHAGGRKMHEPIDPALAGVFFFGPPLCDGDELFLMGEFEGALQLYSLNGADGSVNWTQLLAYTDVAIDRDLARRWWPAPIALSEGVLICPTNVGFLTGIDRRSHEILWMSRYSEKTTQTDQQMQLRGGRIMISGAGSLKERWFPTPPMIIGQTVVHAPPEEAVLIGFRLADGQELWRISDLKQGLYPLGSHEHDLIVVTETGLTGYDARTGKESWKGSYAEFDPAFPTEGSIPCGRGVIMNDQVLLPINGREIWYFDLKTKQFVSRAQVADERLSLGNLVISQGQLAVASPLAVNFFQPKLSVEQEIRERLSLDPRDPEGLMKQALMLSLEHQYEPALAALRQISRAALSDAQHRAWQRQMIDTLIGLVRHTPLEHDAAFAELAELLQTPEDEQLYLRLQADRMLARKDLTGAFAAYARLAEFDGQTLIRELSDVSRAVRQDVWLQGRLQELWSISSGAVSSEMTGLVNRAVAEGIDSGSLQEMLEVVRIYGFHPELEPLYLELIDLALEERDFATAEFALNRMAQLEDPSISATAFTRRVRLLLENQLAADARQLLTQVSRYDDDLVLLDGLTVAEWREEIAQHPALTASDSTPVEPNWSGVPYEVVPIGTTRWSHQAGSVNLDETDSPAIQELRFVFDQKSGRLEISRKSTDELVWSIPLQQMDPVSQASVLPIRFDGQRFVTYYRGVIQCYSLPDQSLLWSRAVASQPGAAETSQSIKYRLPRLQQVQYATARFRLNDPNKEFGPLAVMSSHTLCYLGRNELVAVDPLNGEIRWTRRGIPQGTSVYGDGEMLFVVTPNLRDAFALRTSDGKRIDVPELEALWSRGIAVHGHSVIAIQSGTVTRILGAQEGEATLVSANQLTRENDWERTLQNTDHLGLIDSRTAIIVSKEGGIELIDLKTGEIRVSSQIDPKIIRGQKELFAFPQQNRLFLIANHASNHSTYLNVNNQRISGYLVALDRADGTEQWVHKTPSLNLVLDDIQQMPVFILGGSKHQRKHNLYIGEFTVQMIDKQTGEILLDDAFMTQNQVQQITWSAARRQLRMHAYNSIYTIQPKPALAESPPAEPK